MNLWLVPTIVVGIFVVVACYYALRHPNGKVFPSRRDKLLRKLGPLVEGRLLETKLRFFSAAGGVKRVTLNATYRYEIKGQAHSITLPTDSSKLGETILEAQTVREQITVDEEREFPTAITLSDGTRFEGREAIQAHYFGLLQALRPTVQVLFDRNSPALSTVRDWQ